MSSKTVSKDSLRQLPLLGLNFVDAVGYTTVWDGSSVTDGIMEDTGYEEGLTADGANLHNINWKKMYLCGTSFVFANLSYGKITETDLSGCRFHGAVVDAFVMDAPAVLERMDITFVMSMKKVVVPPKWEG